MALQVVTDSNFATTVGNSTDVYVLLIHDFFPPAGSPQVEQEALMEEVKLHYAQYSLTGITFGHADVADRDLLDPSSGDVKNIRTVPTFVFYDDHVEYYRTDALLTADDLKYYIEQKR